MKTLIVYATVILLVITAPLIFGELLPATVVSPIFMKNSIAYGRDGFVGVPDTRTIFDGKESNTSKVSKSEKHEYRVEIEKSPGTDDVYIWKTREGKKLIRSSSGIYEIYNSVDGAGFVKISKSSLDPMTNYKYLECVHIGLRMICYHGF
jgi:hypothetical protein